MTSGKRSEPSSCRQRLAADWTTLKTKRLLQVDAVGPIDFDGWGDYLGDPPLAMAVLDRIVDSAIVLKLTGNSYRAKQLSAPAPSASKPSRAK